MQTKTLTDMTGADRWSAALADSMPYWRIGFAFFLLALLLRLACFTGLIASDDVYYATYAQQIAEGRYALEYHHFAIRFGLILPVGLLYALFGVNEWSTIGVPFFASSLSVVLLALIGAKLFGIRAGGIAGILLVSFPLQLHYASILVPELVAECYVLLALLIYVRTEERAPMAFGALAGAFIGIAYLTKEPALFVAAALFIDAARQGRWRNVLGIALGIGVVIAVEHAYYLSLTGDLLFRVHAMAKHNLYVTDGRGEVDIANLGYRLIKEYPRMMLIPGVYWGIHSLAAVILAAVALVRFRRDRRAHFLAFWAALPWIYLNFGTSSFNHFIPIPAAPRYIEFVYPPLFLLAGWVLADFISNAAWARRLVLSLTAVAVLSGVVSGLTTRGKGYHSDHVAVLRGIADKIALEGPDSRCVDVTSEQRWTWQPTLFILSGGVLRACGGRPGGVIVASDKYGFPYVASR